LGTENVSSKQWLMKTISAYFSQNYTDLLSIMKLMIIAPTKYLYIWCLVGEH